MKLPTDYTNAQEANENFYCTEALTDEEEKCKQDFLSKFEKQQAIAKTKQNKTKQNKTKQKKHYFVIRQPVSLSGLSSRSRIQVIKQVIQKVGDLQQQVEREQNKGKTIVEVYYSIGIEEYHVKHIPTKNQPGNVDLVFLSTLDKTGNSFRAKMNAITANDKDRSSKIAKLIRESRCSGNAIKLPEDFEPQTSNQK